MKLAIAALALLLALTLAASVSANPRDEQWHTGPPCDWKCRLESKNLNSQLTAAEWPLPPATRGWPDRSFGSSSPHLTDHLHETVTIGGITCHSTVTTYDHGNYNFSATARTWCD